MMGNYKDIAPVLRVFDFDFTQDELDQNWEWMCDRKELLTECIKEQSAPSQDSDLSLPDWLCRECSAKEFCESE